MSCLTCQHVRLRDAQFECHAYPPERKEGADNKGWPNGRWPTVFPDDDCGLWLHRLTPLPKESPTRIKPDDGGNVHGDGADSAGGRPAGS